MLGLLLINLGTPDEPTPAAVRRYLREFLSDPRVLDIPPAARKALLELVILPTRPAKSAAAYQQIWTDRGSPLLFHSRDLAAAVQAELGDSWRVELAMRYGNPSIPQTLETLRQAGVDDIVVLPLYPQYAASSTGSSLERVHQVTGALWNVPRLTVVPPFYDDAGFVHAFAENGRHVLDSERPDHVVFSFHGLPERHMRKSDEGGQHCLARDGCCDRIVPANRHCYRAQCYVTARLLAARLDLPADGYTVSFQSRLGRTPWIRPYTDLVLPELAAAGHRSLAIFCPAFVADCLETLEEIGIRAAEQWRELGGDALTLVPSLNSEPAWVDAVCALARRHAPPALSSEESAA